MRIPGTYCCVCGNCHSKDPHIFFHCSPSDKEKCNKWLQAFEIDEGDIKLYMRVCSRHFPDWNMDNPPNLTLGKRFSSPVKKKDPRAKRAKLREESREIIQVSASRSATPASRSVTPTSNHAQAEHVVHTTPIGDQLRIDYTVHELPSECALLTSHSMKKDIVIDKALLACIEFSW